MMNICPRGHKYRGRRCPECHKTARRGYDYRWRRLSEHYRDDNPLCENCEAEGLIVAADDVHHIEAIADNPSRRLDRTNLIALCRRCHADAHCGKTMRRPAREDEAS